MGKFSRQFIQTLLIYRGFSKIASKQANPIVSISEGKLRGSSDTLYDGSIYYIFKGIPYAKPPIGNLRFKDPIPHEPWIGVRDAINHGHYSYQIELLSGAVKKGNEDCLFLNVYTKSLQPDSKIPVIVFIHGGAFLTGSGHSNVYGPKFLLKHDVILVTLNYRLGAFGFLSLDIPEVPGNAGLKDQVIALRWVQRNIAQFGGDPNNVTVFGESAGGTTLSYHLLSPTTDGLFHKAIIQSGVCVTDWAIDNNAKLRAFMAAELLGKSIQNTGELLEILRNASAEDIMKVSAIACSKEEKYTGLNIYFRPVIEKKFSNVESYLTEDPVQLLQAGKAKTVPTIIGYNSSEGLFMTDMTLKERSVLNRYPSFHVPKEVADKISKQTLVKFGNDIKKFYFDGKDMTEKDVNLMSKLLSDLHFINGNYRFANLYSEISDSIYMYRFNCSTELNFLKNLTGHTESEGACHSDQLFYTFNNPMNKAHYENNEKLRELVENVTKLWTNFAKTGNPTPDDSLGVKWTPYSKTDKQYLNIEPQLTMGRNAEQNRLEFWRNIYEKAGLYF